MNCERGHQLPIALSQMYSNTFINIKDKKRQMLMMLGKNYLTHQWASGIA